MLIFCRILLICRFVADISFVYTFICFAVCRYYKILHASSDILISEWCELVNVMQMYTYSATSACCSRLAAIKVSKIHVFCGWATKTWFWVPASMPWVVIVLLYYSLSSLFHSCCSKYLTFWMIFFCLNIFGVKCAPFSKKAEPKDWLKQSSFFWFFWQIIFWVYPWKIFLQIGNALARYSG